LHKVVIFNLFLALFILTLFHFRPIFAEAIRLRFEDLTYYSQHILGKQHKPHHNLVVVAVDEKSVNELGRWPWNREIMARLVEKMSVAELVAFDVVFSEPSEGDQKLAEAIESSGNVVLGFFFRRDATQSVFEEQVDYLRNSELLRVKKVDQRVGLKEFPFVEVSIPIIANSALMQAPFNSEPDTDGLYRTYPIAYMFHGSLFPSMAFQVYRLYKNEDLELILSRKGIEKASVGEMEIPVFRNSYVLLNLTEPKDIKVVSAVDVLKGEVNLERKIVFFGATEIGIYDMRPTPIDVSTPGVFLHYIALSNLLKGELIRDFSWSAYITIPAPILFLPLFSKLKRLRNRAIVFFIFVLIFIIIPLLSFVYFRTYIPFFYPLISLSLSYISLEAYLYYASEKRIAELRKAFSSYVSPQLLEIILKNPERLRLGGERRQVTVLFSDIRGFTTMSESMEPEVLVAVLNRYFEPMTYIILEEGGMLDKYIGDAIMAVFNAPVDLPEHPVKACMAALRMLEKLKELNTIFMEEYKLNLSIGVGINTGYAVVGNVGSNLRFDYTAMGDTVNLASRLEGLNKLYKTNIIISEYTAEYVIDKFLLRPLDKVAVKGKKKPVLLYELMEDGTINRLIAKLYERSLEEYFKGNFEEAMIGFENLVITYNDGPSSTMLERCRTLIIEPPTHWEGVYVAKEK